MSIFSIPPAAEREDMDRAPNPATCSPSVASVTVAYNGAELLSRHLDGLRRQTRRLDEIVVVNNASSDATLGLLAAKYPEITVLNLPENVGVGGGFAAGLQYAALIKKHDWIWLFDQDSVPCDDSLAQLLGSFKYFDDAGKMAILAPVCVHPGTSVVVPGHVWRGGNFVPVPLDTSQPITLVDSVISSGTLIRRHVIETAGLPRADLFMDFVDYEHCLRVRRHGFNIAIVRDSLVHHTLGEPSRINVAGRTKYFTDHAPWREYYMTRNEIFTVWKYFPQLRVRASALNRLLRHALEILFFGRQKLACFSMMVRGFLDGRAGRLGIRFLPTFPPALSPKGEKPPVFIRASEDQA